MISPPTESAAPRRLARLLAPARRAALLLRRRPNDELRRHRHKAGDQLLCDVAGRLRAAARAGDLVERLGGDEFVLLLGQLPPASCAGIASAVAERVHQGFAEPFTVAAEDFHTSASVGVALFPDDADDGATLLTAADTGMYVSKRGGRGRTSFALGSRHAA